MKFALSSVFLLWALATQAQELPITETDVFVQSGEGSASSIIINARCNSEQDSSTTVTYASEAGSLTVSVADAVAEQDYTVSVLLQGLSSATTYTYSVECSTLLDNVITTSSTGSFKTVIGPDDTADISFVWAADLAGQGWGRNPDLSITTVDGDVIKGGYVVFDVMRATNPDFALFQGDMIYADGPLPASKTIPEEVGGGTWINNPSLDFVAISLPDFRDNWKYNFGDEKMQSFLAEVPIYVQWDDHEVTNNWYPGEVLGEPKYPNGTLADDLAVNSLKAFYESNPLVDGQLLYRTQRFGKHLEIFFLDLRTYRQKNPDNYDPNGIDMMGRVQLDWLKQSLLDSTATWKVISTHDPVGIVTGGDGDPDSWGQADASVLGRERELEELFQTIKDNNVMNVVALTSDVHFTAAVSYDPSRAMFKDFLPFYEFVIGPIHSGAFGPGSLDGSFGPEYEYGKYTSEGHKGLHRTL
jgi:alkaline phosphatase D